MTDAIDFTDMTLAHSSITNFTQGATSASLTVTDTADSLSVTMTLLGQFALGLNAGTGFTLTSDGSSGTDLIYQSATTNPHLGWLAATQQA